MSVSIQEMTPKPSRPLPKAEDIKMIVSDVDGTLLDSTHSLPPTSPTHLTLLKLRQTHPTLPFIISTGKQHRATSSLRDTFSLNHAFHSIHLNGNVIYNPDGSILRESGFEKEVVLEVIERLRGWGDVAFMVYDRERVYEILPGVKGHEGEGEGGEYTGESIWADKLRGYGEDLVGYTVDGSKEILKQIRNGEIKVIKMAVVADESIIDSKRELLQNWPPNLISSGTFAITQALTFCLELIPAAHNKGTALAFLLEHLNSSASSSTSPTASSTSSPPTFAISPANVIVFGDGENDVPMMRVAGMSVAMGNAMRVAREAAVWETGTNDEGGVGLFLGRVFFGES
ncbi:uncharacterized protein STEHIDRAFT_140397 [Stereum hirsutum FP-91666 SS1]|uniref:uncharacterized protein n=1 Tax=Stereum hirsutum (strain FP-91666) TaxID=721885 RepID=UPI00044494C1|nr:uncharacterized protein STEHIDRAFT_140397 [Stereum hirsutum FP-91666 SS1]EIM84856.1 hypothetical protein STEHIDRAFT_140397 [Stereum hirsutum FP-91666 SS1]